MTRELNILKSVLLLRKFNRSTTKEEQIEEVKMYFADGCMTDESLQEWIDGLKEDLAKSPEQLEAEAEEFQRVLEEADAEEARREMEYLKKWEKEYGPSNPWDAPGMSIYDFI